MPPDGGMGGGFDLWPPSWALMGLVLLAALVALGLAGLAYVRLAKDDPALWHADPLAVFPAPRPNYALLLPPEGCAPGAWRWREGFANLPEAARRIREAPVTADEPDALFARLSAVLDALPRSRRLAVDPAARHGTWVIRSRLIGWPDYLSLRVVPCEEGGASLAAFSRARYGRSDLGVNPARLGMLLHRAGLPSAARGDLPAGDGATGGAVPGR